MKPLKNISLVLIVFLIILGLNYSAVEAEVSGQWTPDARVPGYLDDTFTPILVADQNRTVHAFASQWIDDGGNRRQAIVYRKWTLVGGWTRPVDIFLSPTGDARILGAFLASDGKFHLAFWGGNSRDAAIYYSNAMATEANVSSAWSLPELIGEGAIDPGYGAIAGDSFGKLVVVFNGKVMGNGVYAITSNDAGQSWSEPTSIFLTNDVRLAPYFINTYMGKSGRLHVVWGVNDSSGVYDSLYYDGFDFENEKWTAPVLLDKRPNIDSFFGPSYPTVVDNGKYVVVLYNGGNPFMGYQVEVGRPTLLVQLSDDGGQTWGGVTNPIPFLTGNSGELSLVVDSDQVVHAVSIMRIDSTYNGEEYRAIGGIWHGNFKDGSWSYPERFVTSINPANLRAVVSQGNVLLVTWVEDAGEGQDEGVWYAYTTLNTPELSLVELPTGQPLVTSITETPTLLFAEPTLSPSIDVTSLNQAAYSPVLPIILGIVTIIVLFLLVIVMRSLQRHRR